MRGRVDSLSLVGQMAHDVAESSGLSFRIWHA